MGQKIKQMAEQAPPDYLNKRLLLDGTFGDRQIKTELYPVTGNSRLVVNLPGVSGTIHGSDRRYHRFAGFLQGEDLSNVVLMQSSRQSPDEVKPGAAGGVLNGKTFEQEVEDIRRVVTYYAGNSGDLFGVDPGKIELTLHGNSIGGVIALILAREFPQVTNIVTVGTGFGFPSAELDRPVLMDFAKYQQEIRESARDFKGKALVQFGSEDNFLDKNSFFELYRLLGCDERNKDICEFKGVNHKFTRLNGQISKEPYAQVARNMRSVLNGIIPGGVIFLTHEQEQERRRQDLEERTKGLDGVELYPLDPDEK